MSILEVHDVSIRYMTGDFKDIGLKEYVTRKLRGDYHVNEFWADRSVSFSLEEGDMLGIIGTNGAGKSTLLKAISGIMEPTKGWVKREGNIVALLELGSGFDGDLTVRENTYLRGAMLGYTRKFMEETYDQIIDFAELREFQDRPFKQLSSGMKSRLAFSIASLVQPDVLILDEVLSVGDGAFRKKSEKKMKEIISGGATTILVSHSLEQVREMCNKVLWLDKGTQVECGDDVQGICDRYQKFLEDGRPEGKSKDPEPPHLGKSGQVKMSGNEKMFKYIGLYTFVFLFTFLLAYSPFLLAKKSFIILGDGRAQHYPALVYIGRYLRQIVLNIFRGDFTVPLFDLNIGVGADIISTLNYYGLGDPLCLLSVFVPTKYTEYLYDFLAILRVYLAGLSFSALCHYQNKRSAFTLVGALVYAFSGYAIYSAIRHIFFINPMIQLPLLIIGIDLVIRRKKPYIFIGAVFYSAICGFYFLYMMTIMLGIYALVRFFDLFFRDRVKEFLKMAGRIIGNYLLGLGLSAILFVPTVIGFLSSSRSSRPIEWSYLSYGWDYYRNRFLRAIGTDASWDTLSLAAISLLAVVLLLLLRERKYRTLKLLLLVAAIIYILPLGGYVMNGFGYPSQRWTFGFVLLISYVVVEMMPVLLSLNQKENVICLSILLIYSLCVFSSSKNRNVYCVVGVAMLAITLVVLLILGINLTSDKAQNIGAIICILLVAGNTSVNAVYKFAKDQANYVNEFTEYGTETELLESSPVREAEPYLKDQSGRFDSSSSFRNLGMVWRVPTLSFYWSIADTNVSSWWMKTENIQQTLTNNVYGLDQRTIMSALQSTRYFIETENREQYVPYGYSLVEETENKYLIYENQYALPWGYTYDSYISYNELSQRDGLETEECMLQSIALDTDIDTVPRGSIESEIQEIAYEVSEANSLKWENGVLNVEKDNASLTLEFQMVGQVEGYLRLQGFDINNSGQSIFNVTAKCENISKTAMAVSTAYNWYFGREKYLYNLGYSEEERTKCTITFPKKGTYKLADIQLFALPMDKYPEQVEALRAEPLENIEFGTNRITGTVNLSKNKILCMSIPYSKGWTARVDGERVDILRGNYMFMALPLEAGYHDIEFTYCTPGLKTGAVCGLISVGFLVHYAIREKRRKEKVTCA